MEDIYTIKVRSNLDPRDLYPSERRYSATTALGLGVVHLALATTALLLASLSLSYSPVPEHQVGNRYENFTDFEASSMRVGNVSGRQVDHRNDDVAFLDEEISEDSSRTVIIDDTNGFELDDVCQPFITLTLAPCFMAAGALAAGLSGLFAWKRWYVDQNISWFFFMSSISTVTSLACLTITGLTLSQQSTRNNPAFVFSFTSSNIFIDHLKPQQPQPNLRFVLAINLLIASILEFIWSLLSTKVAWKGMRNDYPDDIVVARGRIQVSTTHKGNKKSQTMAPDILNHHPKKRKFAKYFPKNIENDYLPKLESNVEYQERVNKFLSSNLSDIGH